MIAEWEQRLQKSPKLQEWVRIIRFLAVGGLNTLFGYGLYALLLWIGLPLEAALLLCGSIGVLFNFVSYGKLAFGKLNKRNLPRFVGAYLLFYVLNVVLARGLIALGLTAYTAQLVLLPLMAGGMFFTLRLFVYR